MNSRKRTPHAASTPKYSRAATPSAPASTPARHQGRAWAPIQSTAPAAQRQHRAQRRASEQHAEHKAPPARAWSIHACAHQAAQQPCRVDHRAQADGQGQRGMRQPWHQHQVHRLREHQHRDRNAHRRAHVLARVVARRQHLDRHDAQQTDPVGRQRPRALRHVAASEVAMVEQHREHRLREHHQRHRARQRQQHHQPQPPIEHRRIPCVVFARLRRRQLRQQHHAHRHAQQRSGQLHQAIGQVQPRHRPDCQARRDVGVDQQRDLRHRHAQHGGAHLPQHASHARVPPCRGHRARREAQARQVTHSAQCRDLDQPTAPRHPARCRTPPHRSARCRAPRTRVHPTAWRRSRTG